MFVTEHNPNHKGSVAELAIAKEAASLGLRWICSPGKGPYI